GQLALAVVLLFGSVVLARSLYRLLQQDLGFNPQHVLILHTTMNGDEYNNRNLATSIYLPQLQRIRQLPGVQTAGLVTFLPLSLGNADGDFKIVGRAEADNVHSPRANLNAASDDYFRAMQIPLMQGRFFSESDGLGAPRVAIVNDELAHKYFAGQDPVGKQIVFSDPDSAAARPLTIVGVVHGSRQRTLAAPPQAEIYFSMRQIPNNTIWSQFFLRSIMTYVVRSEGKPEAQTAAVQAAIQGVEPGETVFDVRPMEDVVSHFVEDRRLSLVLLGSFAGLALIVAAAGLFAMLSYSVRQRTQEIAVRMALGASHADVLQLIGRHALRLTVIGLGAGVVAAIVAGNLAASMLFGVQSWDPVTLCATTLTLLLVALPSAFFPAHRAASVNVLEALRTE
ncbi:MAG TPA: ABC transporter permease, partial [Alphaproteobacteria bacterium]|nr:ABC transporter permease [Alphaproteobacteria bacterium]